MSAKRKPRRAPKPQPTAAEKSWSERLRELRAKIGNITQAQAAERIGISQSQWSAFEAGKRAPTRPIAKLIGLLESGKI